MLGVVSRGPAPWLELYHVVLHHAWSCMFVFYGLRPLCARGVVNVYSSNNTQNKGGQAAECVPRCAEETNDPSIHRDHTLCRVLVLLKQTPGLVGTIATPTQYTSKLAVILPTSEG